MNTSIVLRDLQARLWSSRPEPAWLDWTITGPYLVGVLAATTPWHAVLQHRFATAALAMLLVMVIAGLIFDARERRLASRALSDGARGTWAALRAHVADATTMESLRLLRAYEGTSDIAQYLAWFPSTRLSAAVLLTIGVLCLTHGIVGPPTPWAQTLFQIAVVLPWFPVGVVVRQFTLDAGQLVIENVFALGLFRTVRNRVNLREPNTRVSYDRGFLVIESTDRAPTRIDLQFLSYPYRFFAAVLHASRTPAGSMACQSGK